MMATPKPSKAARSVFLLLHVEGLSLAVEGDRLAVRPASALTDDLRELIRSHRDDLIRLTVDGADGFDPRRFPETTKILAEFRRVFGPGCRLKFAIEREHTFGEPSAPGVPISESHAPPDRGHNVQ